MESAIQTLPSPADLSPSAVSFLDNKLGDGEALSGASSLVSELQSECAELDRSLIGLNRSLGKIIAARASFSDRIHALLGGATAQLAALGSSTSDVLLLGKDLPALAKEVARLDTVRIYAETALKLDTLVGDIEDAVSSTMKRNIKRLPSKDLEDMRLRAIETLKQTEDILTSVTTTHPQWGRLVSSVDHRVDRALAMLRPQAIVDHRALLASLGWPPPLSSTTSATSTPTNSINPLFTMHGELKHQYRETFFALCNLQELQRRRKSRQLAGYKMEAAMHQPLWVIEELVNPISLASQRHFSKWVEKPEFIFALVYKITRDYVDSMDELLQPLVDEAMLSGYSCREEWISGMISSLSTYLAKEIFPKYVAQLGEESDTGAQSQARTSWLHLIDLMVSFDKQIKTLLEHSGISLSSQDDENVQKVSSLNVFHDRPEWLELWADIELGDVLYKLNNECAVERNWTGKFKVETVSSDPENYKAPAISSLFLKILSSVIDRCRSLPNTRSALRSRFLRLAGAPIIQKFLDCLLLRCQEAEGLTALTDNDALIKVANSINAARFIESVLKEWCEDVFFLEIGSNQGNGFEACSSENVGGGLIEEGLQSGVFDAEIGKLEAFRIEWVEKTSVVTLRGFDSLCRDYMKNKKQWHEKGEEGWTVSKSLVGALDYLQAKMSVLEVNLNGNDFVGVWRSLAAGIDRLVFNGILLSNVKFHDGGVERFGRDLDALFGVFRSWCLRPEGFFPKASNGLKVLKMSDKQLKTDSSVTENWMKENKIGCLSVTETDRIVKSRVVLT